MVCKGSTGDRGKCDKLCDKLRDKLVTRVTSDKTSSKISKLFSGSFKNRKTENIKNGPKCVTSDKLRRACHTKKPHK